MKESYSKIPADQFLKGVFVRKKVAILFFAVLASLFGVVSCGGGEEEGGDNEQQQEEQENGGEEDGGEEEDD